MQIFSLKRYSTYIFFTLFSCFGIVLLIIINLDHDKKINEANEIKLYKAHHETLLKLEATINVYQTLVAAIKSFCHHSNSFPTEIEMKNFLSELVNESKFNDSLTVSFISKEQLFQYAVTPNKIDPAHLKGLDVKKIRPKHEIKRLDSLIQYGTRISLFAPINLIEGYPAFPFNFPAINSKNERVGYIATVLSTAYLLNPILQVEKPEFIHQFSIQNIIFNRYTVYDGTKTYSKKKDEDVHTNFYQKEHTITASTIPFCGLKLKIETRFKQLPKTDNFYSYLIVLWLVLLIIFIIISSIQYHNNQTYLRQLKKANMEILQKSMEQERNYKKIQNLLSEIHHRVKNNMQIIASLLNLQSNDQLDENVKQALQSCKNRVQSMALVHSKLYGNENFSEINVSDYVLNLFQNITDGIHVSEHEIKLDLTIAADIQINLDTIIPLGLILNELITNSIKYAFIDKTKPPYLAIKLVKNDDFYHLTYLDNGSGFNLDEIKRGFGLELIDLLIVQLKGHFSYSSDSCSKFELKFQEI